MAVFLQTIVHNIWTLSCGLRCDGRVVKALDLKSNTVSVRRFESCSQRSDLFFLIFIFVSVF